MRSDEHAQDVRLGREGKSGRIARPAALPTPGCCSHVAWPPGAFGFGLSLPSAWSLEASNPHWQVFVGFFSRRDPLSRGGASHGFAMQHFTLYALHKTELLYRNLAKSLKLAPFWCSYPLRQSPTGEVEKMI